MRKSLKLIATILSLLFLTVFCVFIYFFYTAGNAKFDPKKLVNLERTITFLDNNENILSEQSGGVEITEISKIPEHVKNAFIAIEDKRFYSHKGIDYKSVARALVNNVKTKSFKEGASTITQQLIKNTHLSNEKTLKRKVLEYKLAKKLEKNYTKDEILEMYLNTIYFGDGCYGITSAAKRFFDKPVCELNINESATLSAIIKAPSNYSPITHSDKCNKRKNIVLREMFNQKYISESEYNKYKNIDIQIQNNNIDGNSFISLVKSSLSKITNENPYFDTNIKIHTTLNSDFQKIVDDVMIDFSDIDTEKSVVLFDKCGNILAYNSTCGNVSRQLGSIIKPILVYAPAINENIVNQYTFLDDKKTDFSGYSPSNYNDKYYGKITLSQAVAKSSNVCAVKVLNDLGVEKALKYIGKTNLIYTKNDKNLSIALGCIENGAKLTDITACYNVFNNNGYYSVPKCLKTITNTNGKILYQPLNKQEKFIDSDSAEIMNYILSDVVSEGTAKKLKNLNFNLCAKTGTVGDINGNKDAYVISYTADYTLGIWLGNKENSLLPNNISGGTVPCEIASEIWKEIYKDKKPQSLINNSNLTTVKLDKISYEQDGKLILADENSPERYVFEAKLKNSSIPKFQSTRFSSPKIDKYEISSVNNCGIKIKLCHAEHINALVYRIENNKKQLLFDTKKDGSSFLDALIKNGTVYQYLIIPYFENAKKTFTGKEILTEKIKSPNIEFDDKWWQNEFNFS